MLERTRGLFGRSVRSCNVNIYLSGTPTAHLNAASSLGGNFAVQYDTCTPFRPSLSTRDMSLPLRRVGFEKECEDGIALRWSERETEAG
jgi:hypothetical protein